MTEEEKTALKIYLEREAEIICKYYELIKEYIYNLK